VQDDFTPQRVSQELRRLIPEGEERAAMLQGFREVRQRLEPRELDGGASDRAAEIVLAVATAGSPRKHGIHGIV
jgi:lipid A disaccharide synthetase